MAEIPRRADLDEWIQHLGRAGRPMMGEDGPAIGRPGDCHLELTSVARPVPGSCSSPTGPRGNVSDGCIADHVKRGHFFWLDLEKPTDEKLQQLAEKIGLHPLRIEDARTFSQRPKLDEYEGYVFQGSFIAFGLGLLLVSIIVFLIYFRSKRWM